MNTAAGKGGLYVFGAGGHGLVVAETAEAAGFAVLGLFDDTPPADGRLPWPMLGDGSAVGPDASVGLIVAIGDNAARRAVAERLGPAGWRFTRVIHPAAWVSPRASIGPGAFVGPGAVVNTLAVVEAGAIVNSGAVIEHHGRVGAFAHVGPGAALGGATTVGAGTLIGLGASVLPGVRIGERATVGAGAVVLAEVADGQTVVGCPARPILARG